MNELTHFDRHGRAWMVDVSDKGETSREAVARGAVKVQLRTLHLIKAGGLAKGDVLGVAQVGGIMGAKKTAELIPMCHPLMLTGTGLEFRLDEVNSRIEIQARVKTTGKTGVEMEALTAVAVAALTIYDMCKAVDKTMIIEDVRLVAKMGGRSGTFLREGEDEWEK